MCGICGVFSPKEQIERHVLESMTDQIVRRGPDDSGYYFDDRVAMGMRRLSIQDVSGGKQPLFSNCGRYIVVFNGEIYNFKTLTESLKEKGYVFNTHTDTEVLVHLYSEYGDEMLHYLRGMFAFSLWDKKLKRAIVVRDRLGIKPLHYTVHEGRLIYGSELKSILVYPTFKPKLNKQAIDAFLKYTYIPAPLTAYKDVSKLLPGHYLIWQDGETEIKKYWDISFVSNDDNTEQQWVEAIEQSLLETIELHLESDVPVGSFLSGGVDSGLVTALMTKVAGEPFNTFTMGFGGKASHIEDERPYAEEIARKFGLVSNSFEVKPDAVGIIAEIVDAFDEPFADDSVFPSYYISQYTAKSVKVALSGLGGDELFAGYSRYEGMMLSEKYDKITPLWLRKMLINPLIQLLPDMRSGGKVLDHLKRFSQYSVCSPKERYLGYISSLSNKARAAIYVEEFKAYVNFDKTDDLVGCYFDELQSDSLLDKLLYTDIKTYLPDDILALSDRVGMWHSLELRVPFVDHKFMELAATVPSRFKIKKRNKKYILKEVAKRYLPDKVVSHKKQGFEAPMAGWLRNELKPKLYEALLNGDKACHKVVKKCEIKRLVDEHVESKAQNNKILFSLLMLQIWMERSKVEI